ncbi:MAG: copper amine oxidase N-terminal domain-containing protein [Treponema sp.]|jgi:hypothetical protein|nr:copper amine oxidase N-terminal domain-containing protein [Treponema sp.]
MSKTYVVLVLLITLTLTACSEKSKNIVALKSTIFVDIQGVDTDTPPHTVNGITMVPVRALMEKIGYEVKWFSEAQRLEVWEPSGRRPKIVMIAGHPVAFREVYTTEIDGFLSSEEPLDTPPVLINNRMLAPLNFITWATGYTVDYTMDTEDIYLFSPRLLEAREGEGKGVSQPLTEEEKNYILSFRTEN